MISAKEVLNKNIKKGYSAIKKFRDALVDKLYETSVVVNKVTIEVDDKTGKVTENSILGVIGHGPVAEAFGLDRDYRAKNVTVEEEVNNIFLKNGRKQKPNTDVVSSLTSWSHMYIFATKVW